MLFYSMLNSENKTYDLKKIFPIMLCRFSIEYCTKEIPYFAHWIFNKILKKFGYQALNEYSAESLIIACVFEE